MPINTIKTKQEKKIKKKKGDGKGYCSIIYKKLTEDLSDIAMSE